MAHHDDDVQQNDFDKRFLRTSTAVATATNVNVPEKVLLSWYNPNKCEQCSKLAIPNIDYDDHIVWLVPSPTIINQQRL